MLIRKTVLLPVIFLISFLSSGCLTSFIPIPIPMLYGYSHRYYYDGYLKINTESLELKFAFESSTHPTAVPALFKGGYSPNFWITASEGKFIKNVSINRVIVYTGKNEYSMLENDLKMVLSSYRRNSDDKYWGTLHLSGNNLDDIRRTGFIDFNMLVNHFPFIQEEQDWPLFLIQTIHINPSNVIHVSFYFSSPGGLLFYKEHKEIKILYRFSVELTTGEIIAVRQEVIAKRKVGNYQSHRGLLSVP